MSYIIVGLGNPGVEYEKTRHNTGRIVLEAFRIAEKFPDWELDLKIKALTTYGKICGGGVVLVEPETYMNKSGETVGKIKLARTETVRSGGDLKFKTVGKGKDKRIELNNLAVIHDDLDIPFGKFKISFNKSSGGHRGVESIIKAVKTEAFVRVRVGIAASVSMVKKSQDDKTVEKIILGKFSPDQFTELKKLSKQIVEALRVLVSEGREKAMSRQYGS